MSIPHRAVRVAAAVAGLALIATACERPQPVRSSSARPGGSSTPAASTTASGPGTPGATSPTTPPAGTTSAPARPVAATSPCTHNHGGRQVRVSLKAQHLWLCQGTRAVYDSAITSGVPGQYTSTPTGNYRIQGRNRNSTLTLNTGRTFEVKYWIPFDAPLFGFHDSPWQKFPYGSSRYKTDGSHGCIHLPLSTIKHLYDWAPLGTRVHIA